VARSPGGKPQPDLRVIPDAHVQEQMPPLHHQQRGIKHGRVHVVSKLGRHAEAHGALLLVPVIHPLESAKAANQSNARIGGGFACVSSTKSAGGDP
jgi:hypothetical protein